MAKPVFSNKLPVAKERQSKGGTDRLEAALGLVKQLDKTSKPIRKILAVQQGKYNFVQLKGDPKAYRLLRQYNIFKARIRKAHSGIALSKLQTKKLKGIHLKSAFGLKKDFSEFLKYSKPPYYRQAKAKLSFGQTGQVLKGVGGKICTCTLSDGKRKRTYPTTREICIAAATQYGLEWDWSCDDQKT